MKIAVDMMFLLELKRAIIIAIIIAITSEDGLDGLDGLDGEYLLSRLNDLTGGIPEDQANEALSKIASDEFAESVELIVSHTDGGVSTISGKTPAMYSETNLAGSTELHLTDERLGIHTQWVEMSVRFRLDEATIEYKPSSVG